MLVIVKDLKDLLHNIQQEAAAVQSLDPLTMSVALDKIEVLAIKGIKRIQRAEAHKKKGGINAKTRVRRQPRTERLVRDDAGG